MGVNFGLSSEARRLGLAMELYEAGGYGHLQRQVKQIQNCIQTEPDGLIVGAISATGLNEIVDEARSLGLPVIDLVNGIDNGNISARSAVSFHDMEFKAGKYAVEYAEKTGKDLQVAWFPGPSGAGWVEAGDAGFRDALKGSRVKIVATKHGDTGLKAQEALITAALSENETIDVIVGTAVTAEAAIRILRKQKRADRIKVMAYYYSPGVHRGIRRGAILSAPTDLPVIQGRIAIDQAARILEGKPVLQHVSPKIKIIDRAALKTFDADTTLAPAGFRPVMSVN